jgi:hypothetical protein
VTYACTSQLVGRIPAGGAQLLTTIANTSHRRGAELLAPPLPLLPLDVRELGGVLAPLQRLDGGDGDSGAAVPYLPPHDGAFPHLTPRGDNVHSETKGGGKKVGGETSTARRLPEKVGILS